MRASDLASVLECVLVGNPNRKVLRLSSPHNAKEGSLVFCSNEAACAALNPWGCIIIVPRSFIQHRNNTYISVDNPRLAFAKAAQFFISKHPGMYRDDIAVDPSSHVHSTVVMHGIVTIGYNVTVQEFCSIGTAGFGYERDEESKWVFMPQIGGVVIGRNVDIAAHTNIHRGTLENTVIGEGSKISIHCNIGHNTIIGKHTFVAGKSNLGGKTKIGDYCFIGMGTITKPGVEIGDNVTIGMGSIVTKDISSNVIAFGNPCKVMKEVEKQ